MVVDSEVLLMKNKIPHFAPVSHVPPAYYTAADSRSQSLNLSFQNV